MQVFGSGRAGPSPRPVGRCAGPVLSPMRISAHLGASWTREARVFIGQSSETPGALESGMRRSSGGLRDGIARADVSIHRGVGGAWRGEVWHGPKISRALRPRVDVAKRGEWWRYWWRCRAVLLTVLGDIVRYWVVLVGIGWRC